MNFSKKYRYKYTQHQWMRLAESFPITAFDLSQPSWFVSNLFVSMSISRIRFICGMDETSKYIISTSDKYELMFTSLDVYSITHSIVSRKELTVYIKFFGDQSSAAIKVDPHRLKLMTHNWISGDTHGQCEHTCLPIQLCSKIKHSNQHWSPGFK